MTNLMTKFINFWLRFSYKCILTNHHLIETVYRLRKFCDLSLFKGFLNWTSAAAAAAKSLQSCPTLCDPIEGTPPGFPIPGILQARTLEWVAISFSNAGKWSHSVMSDPQRPHGLQPTRLLHPWDLPGKSTGVGCHCLLWILFHR